MTNRIINALSGMLFICLLAGPFTIEQVNADTSEFKKAVAAERKGDYQRAHYTFSILA